MIGANYENLTHEMGITMNNYDGQHIVIRACACLTLRAHGADNEN